MAIAIAAEGTLSAVIGTEHVLTSLSAGTFVLEVDPFNMGVSDITIVRMRAKVRSASSFKLAYQVELNGAQTELVVSVPLPAFYGVEFTLQQTGLSTGRSYPWAVTAL